MTETVDDKLKDGSPNGDPAGKPTDEELLDAYRKGHQASFTLLLERYRRELFVFLYHFLGDRATAEDVFQEAFLQVHQSAAGFDLHRRFRPWLFTIAANKARDQLRRRSRHPSQPIQASIDPASQDSGNFIDLIESAQELPDEPMQREEMRQRVAQVMANMPDNLREVLLLAYFNQFSYKRMSEILDIPLGTVKSRLHAAVANFAQHWKDANSQGKTA